MSVKIKLLMSLKVIQSCLRQIQDWFHTSCFFCLFFSFFFLLCMFVTAVVSSNLCVVVIDEISTFKDISSLSSFKVKKAVVEAYVALDR